MAGLEVGLIGGSCESKVVKLGGTVFVLSGAAAPRLVIRRDLALDHLAELLHAEPL